ncbi:carboxyl-terminal-processing peptidase 3, chloroplastic-like [Rhododendron vialii]|uniref:carboxyl-terminal-processing peptidase 3, chloroplastic-like n=1 Tax=Rhododendron vialii TaxID=182163 RepID=UPI00265FB030|nr:carboxyl-terminal-processing peptidase 3, chloroplastic-like [Rhododendron vialii]XP_058225210.1 carboxyl-terminal-processing peptidase 3, chloroplastic-like [Rhododendron vialii]XP_058225211.1 carboxyl-terminal-processing peptidase 3, chloroplastic-like [Rhododendron vialii]
MVEMFPLRSADAAYNKISGMLSRHGDPCTLIISRKEYQSFRIGSDGNLQGVGLFINMEPETRHLVAVQQVALDELPVEVGRHALQSKKAIY